MRKYLFLFVCQICLFLPHTVMAVVCNLDCSNLGGSCKTFDYNTGCCIECKCGSVLCPGGYGYDNNCNCVKQTVAVNQCVKGQYWAGVGIKGFCMFCPNDGTTDDVITDELGFIKIPEITDCYIPAGQIMTDATGSYSFTADCPYVE